MNSVKQMITQMINKGQVMSEEIKGQLAERLPGTLSIAARAAGFGEGEEGISKFLKAMEKGLIRSKEFLPKFADELNKSLEGIDPAETMGFKMTQLSNEWENLKLDLFEGGFGDTIKQFTTFLTSLMSESSNFIKAGSRNLQRLFAPIVFIVDVLAIAMRELNEYLEPNNNTFIKSLNENLKITDKWLEKIGKKLEPLIEFLSKVMPSFGTAVDLSYKPVSKVVIDNIMQSDMVKDFSIKDLFGLNPSPVTTIDQGRTSGVMQRTSRSRSNASRQPQPVVVENKLVVEGDKLQEVFKLELDNSNNDIIQNLRNNVTL